MITIDEVKAAWAKFLAYTDHAEQNEFPLLIMFHLKMETYYEDLLENWDEHHAEMWMHGMNMMFEKLGIKEKET